MKSATSARPRPAGDLPSLGPVLDFMRVIWHVDHALQKTSKGMQARFGVTGPQRLVLRIVGRFPGITAGTVARLLRIHPGTLTGVLRRLEDKGWIRRVTDPRDARRSLLSLTPTGKRFDFAAEGTVEAAVRRVIDRMPARTLEAAREALAGIAEALEEANSSSAERASRREKVR